MTFHILMNLEFLTSSDFWTLQPLEFQMTFGITYDFWYYMSFGVPWLFGSYMILGLPLICLLQ